jgi:hypothetical protein
MGSAKITGRRENREGKKLSLITNRVTTNYTITVITTWERWDFGHQEKLPKKHKCLLKGTNHFILLLLFIFS